MTTILLVEDDRSLGATLKERLLVEGYALVLAASCEEARRALAERSYDLMLVDVGLPDGDGFELVRGLGSAAPATIFLTAMSSAENRLTGFELGAVDYIPKPFHLKEILLRIKRALEAARKTRSVQVGSLTIDMESMSLRLPDGTVEYPQTRDFQVLQLLIESAPRVVSRKEILDKFWKDDTLSTERTVDNAILRLRQHLRKGADDTIRSVRGIGYQWVDAAGQTRNG
ncbi:MAG: hypothetical protein RL417_1814 [Pseudomonadota bacterium]